MVITEELPRGFEFFKKTVSKSKDPGCVRMVTRACLGMVITHVLIFPVSKLNESLVCGTNWTHKLHTGDR
jgi:hypothetical protein